MAYTPQFGGTNGVPELDIGQEGSPRRGAGTAMAVVQVTPRGTEARTVETPLPQQNRVFGDVLGFADKPVIWRCSIRTTTAALMATILNEIAAYRTGQLYTAGVGHGAFDETRIRPTRLRDNWDNVLSDDSVLKDYETITPIRRISGSGFTCMTELVITFAARR